MEPGALITIVSVVMVCLQCYVGYHWDDLNIRRLKAITY